LAQAILAEELHKRWANAICISEISVIFLFFVRFSLRWPACV